MAKKIGRLQIEVTPEGDVHIFGANHVVTYGNLRADGTRMVTIVDNNCPNRTRGGQIIKFVRATLDAVNPLFKLAGGEAAVVSEVCDEGKDEGQAVLSVRPDGTPGKSKKLHEVGTLVHRR